MAEVLEELDAQRNTPETTLQIAKRLGVTIFQVRRWSTRGLLSNTHKKRVYLKRWKTVKGWVSSQAAIDEFERLLND